MNLKHNLKVIWIFYKQVAIFNLVFTICSLLLYIKMGSMVVFAAMFWTKVIGFAAVTFYYYLFRKNDFYFYYNLGFSWQILTASVVFIDSFLFAALLSFTWIIMNS